MSCEDGGDGYDGDDFALDCLSETVDMPVRVAIFVVICVVVYFVGRFQGWW